MVDDSEVSNRCYTDVVRKSLSWSDKTILNSMEEDIEISFLEVEEEIHIVVRDSTIQDVQRIDSDTGIEILSFVFFFC